MGASVTHPICFNGGNIYKKSAPVRFYRLNLLSVVIIVLMILKGKIMTFAWSDFWVGLCANLIADLVIGIILYFLLTNLPEKRRERENLKNGLSNLKEELILNQDKRIPKLILELKNLPEGLVENPQFMLAHNAWESIKTTGLLPKIKNVKLVHNIFQVEEQINEVNILLHEVQRLVFIDTKTMKKENELPKYTIKVCEKVKEYLEKALPLLENEIKG
jgi:hypothetical protein